MSDHAKLKFAQIAVQYYVAGRSAAISQLIPVLGNLFHHAIEMSLKAGLAEHKALPELKKLNHDLTKIWNQFKGQYPTAASTKFDDVIVELQRFEELRYPDSVLAQGASMELILFREHLVGVPGTSPTAVPRYAIILEDIDDLMAFILGTASLNPHFFVGSMGPEGRRCLLLHNRLANVWE